MVRQRKLMEKLFQRKNNCEGNLLQRSKYAIIIKTLLPRLDQSKEIKIRVKFAIEIREGKIFSFLE